MRKLRVISRGWVVGPVLAAVAMAAVYWAYNAYNLSLYRLEVEAVLRYDQFVNRQIQKPAPDPLDFTHDLKVTLITGVVGAVLFLAYVLLTVSDDLGSGTAKPKQCDKNGE